MVSDEHIWQQFVHCDTPPASTCLGWRNKHELQAILADRWQSGMVTYWAYAVRYWRSACWRHFIDAAVPSHVRCFNSIVFCETNLDLICVFSITLILSVRPLSLSLSSPPSLSLSPSLVCMCEYEPITRMEKPQIVHSQWSEDLMNFCVVLWL